MKGGHRMLCQRSSVTSGKPIVHILSISLCICMHILFRVFPVEREGSQNVTPEGWRNICKSLLVSVLESSNENGTAGGNARSVV